MRCWKITPYLMGIVVLNAVVDRASAGDCGKTPKIVSVSGAQVQVFEPKTGKPLKEKQPKSKVEGRCVKKVMPNGRFMVSIDGADYLINPFQVRTDKKYELKAECTNMGKHEGGSATRAWGKDCNNK